MLLKPGQALKVRDDELCELGDAHATTAFLVDWNGSGGRDIIYSVYPNMFGEGIYAYLEDKVLPGELPIYRPPFRLEFLTGYNAVPLSLSNGRGFHLLVYGQPTRQEKREANPGWLKLYRNTGSPKDPVFTSKAELVQVNGDSLIECLPESEYVSFTPIPGQKGDATDILVTGLYNYTKDYWPDEFGRDYLEYPNLGANRSYDEGGNWKGREDLTRIYRLRNLASNDAPKFSEPELLYEYKSLDGRSDALIMDVDQDGNEEIVIRKDVDRLYFVKMQDGKGTGDPIEMACSPLKRGYFQTSLCSCDIDKDENSEILITGNPGVIFYLDCQNGSWIEAPPLERKGGDVRCETLSVPCAADLDGDGDLDLLVGDSSGYIWYFENDANESTGYSYKRGIRLKAGGEEIHHLAGETGSIQGPCEARWGYMNPLLVDWDGDGLLDIINNDIKSEYAWFRNIGTKENPEFDKAVPLLLNGEQLKGAWRSRPASWGDGGLVVLNFDGFLQLFHRDKNDPRSVHEGKLLRYKDGGLIRGCGPGGLWGRSVFCSCDWDLDGIPDIVGGTNWLLMGLFNGHFPRKAGVFWLKNIGTLEEPVFERARLITLKDGTAIDMVSHKCSPWCVDLDGDGEPDLVSGSEDGKVYAWLRRDLKWDWDQGTSFK